MVVKDKKQDALLKEYIEFLREHPVEAAYKLLGVKLVPHQRIMVKEAWDTKFVCWILGRGMGKTYMLAVMGILRAMLFPEEKVVIVGPSFRQSQLIFAEMEKILRHSAFFQQSLSKPPLHHANGFSMYFNNDSWVKAIPLGADGSTLRGLRATLILVDETAKVSDTIINSVILPFAATVRNPTAKYFGDLEDDMENSVIFASSAYYQFNHLYAKFLSWRELVLEGDPDYSLQRYNYLDAPEGFADMKMVEYYRKNFTEEQFDMEILAKFPTDSKGFYPSSLLHSCTEKGIVPVLTPREGCLYVLGVDPARQDDRFAMTVVEVGPHEMQVANCCAYENISFPEMVNRIDELDNIYDFTNINLDAGGGGLAIRDLLRTERLSRGQDGKLRKKMPYLVVDDKDTEGWNGRRHIHLVAFGSPSVNEMNFSLKKNFEDKLLKFPSQPTLKPKEYNEAAEVALTEISALRNELETIQTDPTQHGYLKFYAPGTLKKDRYSSLLLANFGANVIVGERLESEYAKVSELPSGFWLPESRGI